jgi:hypothetical protein
MRGLRKVLGAVLGVVCVAAFASSVSAQSPSGLSGTWKLSLAKSTFSPGPPPKSMTITYTPVGETLKIVVDVVPPNGAAQRWEMTAAYDGKEHPVTGNPDADMIALKNISATEGESTFTKGGKVTAVNTRTLSVDGRTLTITTKGTSAEGKPRSDVAVFEKQP